MSDVLKKMHNCMSIVFIFYIFFGAMNKKNVEKSLGCHWGQHSNAFGNIVTKYCKNKIL